MKIEKITLSELFYLKFKIPTDLLAKIREEIDGMILDNFQNCKSFNYNLVGAIRKQFFLPQSKAQIDKFFSGPDSGLPFKARVFEDDTWVNFQTKYEYNPIHDHAQSADLSFVLWLNIPYDTNDEEAYFNRHIRSKENSNSRFEFVFPTLGSNRLLQTYTINVDKSYEGVMIMFPAWLPHAVTPFYTSDDYRISVAGNLTFLKNIT